MPYQMLIPIHGLSLLKQTTVEIDEGIFISNDHEFPIREGLANREFALEVGAYYNWIIGTHPFVYIRSGSNINIREVAEKYNLYISYFLSNLWHIKDNAVFNMMCFIQDVNDRSKVSCNQRDSFTSNSSGEFTTSEFDIVDFEKAKLLSAKLLEFRVGNKVDFSERIEGDNGNIISGPLNFISYNANTRIMRAMIFLDTARRTTFMPMKVTAYVAILECLFTTDDNQISKKVRERASYYLGGSSLNIEKNKKAIKEAYDIRSKYMHGQELSKKTSGVTSIKLLSMQLDELLRELIIKVTQDKHIFNASITDLQKHFDSWGLQF